MTKFAERLFVVAAHPDDDTIGCGGAMAHVVNHGGHVLVAVVSDGRRSHPGSRRFPPDAVAAIREREARAALAALGVTRPPLFLAFPDGELSTLGSARVTEVITRLAETITRFAPDVVLAPWRRDPHPDHVAASGFACAAVAQAGYQGRFGFYEVWLPIRGEPADFPQAGEASVSLLPLDDDARDRKRRALYAHHSQTSALIDDDPDGFRISPALADRWLGPQERFYWHDPLHASPLPRAAST